MLNSFKSVSQTFVFYLLRTLFSFIPILIVGIMSTFLVFCSESLFQCTWVQAHSLPSLSQVQDIRSYVEVLGPLGVEFNAGWKIRLKFSPSTWVLQFDQRNFLKISFLSPVPTINETLWTKTLLSSKEHYYSSDQAIYKWRKTISYISIGGLYVEYTKT